MKRFLALALALLLCLPTVTVLADGLLIMPSPNAFPFKDVDEKAWYYEDVKNAYDLKLINGKGSSDTYKPDDNMTYAEAAKLAACMHQLYTAGEVTLANGSPEWYSTYVEYCKTNGIITKDHNYTETATRSGYMEIFAKALPDEALKKINIVPANYVPDVKSSADYAPAVYKLYEAGIVAGVDAQHNCNPKSNIKRSEVAAILSRMMDPQKRVSVGFEKEKENEVTFGFFSDVHNVKNDFANAMNTVFALSDNGADLDGLVLVGDIVYLATNDSLPGASTYSMINSNDKYAQIKSEGKLVFAMGNHEFPLNANDKEKCDLSKQVFVSEVGQEPESHKVLEGYHFITAGPNTYSGDLTAEQESYVVKEVTEALKDGTEKPVFLMLHHPVDNTLVGTRSAKRHSEYFENFVKSQPRLIVVSGHMHYPSSDPQTIYQVPGGSTFVYTSSIMGGNGTKGLYATERHSNWPCQGMMVKINTETNVVTLKRFYSGSGVPAYLEGGDWTLDIPAMIDENGNSNPDLDVYKYTEARKDDSKAPFFKEDDKITVSEVTETTAKISFPVPQPGAAGENHVAAYYKIVVTNNNTKEVLKDTTVVSDYFLKTKKASYSYNLIDLPSDTPFTVSVTPINPWNISGEAITTVFSTPEPKFAPVNVDDTKSLNYIVAEAEHSGSGTFYPAGATVPNLLQIGSSSMATLRYIVEIKEPGKYRVFFNGGAAGAAEIKVTVASVDVTYTEKADGTEKMKVTTKETLVDDKFFVSTGNLNTIKPLPCADVEFKEAGTYSVRFKKYATPYTIGTEGITVSPIVE